jgi:hypothetical protein
MFRQAYIHLNVWRRILWLALILLGWSDVARSQIQQPALNQFELDKQFLGTWQAHVGKDTTITITCALVFHGIETYYAIESKGRITFEEKDLLGYDKARDKLLEFAVDNTSPNSSLSIMWFTSEHTAIEIPFEDLPHPEQASVRLTFEITSPETFVLTSTERGKAPDTYHFHRVKKEHEDHTRP